MRNSISFTTFLTRAALLVSAAIIVPSCSQKDTVAPALNSTAASADAKSADKTKTFYGPAVPLGQGAGRAWVKVNDANQPIAIGLELSAKSVENQGHEEENYVFQLPKQVAALPYDHIEFGWNPHGHEPEIYTLPHFDVHFYMISSAQQATIPFLAPPTFDVPLAPKYVAPAYVQTPGLVPNMGAHWVDVLSSEFQPGGTFTKTFIYGSYNGELAFLEPMITLAYLQQHGTETTPIRQPEAFQRTGYYPTSYTISYDTSPKQYVISLDNLQYHTAQ
jgi:hypothetical protein